MPTETKSAVATLYYCETLNPRKACAVAKLVDLPIDFVRVDLGKGEHTLPAHLARNPNGKVPVLTHEGGHLWESLAIMVWLAGKGGSPLWPHTGEHQAEVLRWASWDAFNFLPKVGQYYFEYYIKPLLGLGTPNEAAVEGVAAGFHQAATILDAQLDGRQFVTGDQMTIADFCLAAALPHAEQIRLPLAQYAHIRRWHDRLMAVPAWRNPWPNQTA